MPRLLAGCELNGAAWLYPHGSGRLRLQSLDSLSLAIIWIWEWHAAFPDVMLWWLRRTFKCWWWCLPPPFLSKDGLCNIVLMYYLCTAKIPLPWNNMFLRLACFQTSYLLKLEALRWRGTKRLLQPGWDWALKLETTVIITTASSLTAPCRRGVVCDWATQQTWLGKAGAWITL